MSKSIAVQVIEAKMAEAKDSFEFFAIESKGDPASFLGKLAQDYLQREIILRVLLDDVLEAEKQNAK